MKKIILSALLSCVLFASSAVAADKSILISTTTSTENSGLLAYLLPIFTKETGIEVKVVAKGTGAAIKDGVDGNVDAILVHDTPRELEFVKNGYGTQRYYVMYNDFVIIGDKSDKAKIKDAKSTADAFQKIANAKAPFISRGDDSGTHAKEKAIWAMTNVPLQDGFPASPATWYNSIGQGMGKTIIMADEKQAYTLSDRATFYSMKYAEPKATTELDILFEGDNDLLNPYGYIPVDSKKHPKAKLDYATIFGDWLVSPKGQAAIAGFTAQGKQLFFPAEKN